METLDRSEPRLEPVEIVAGRYQLRPPSLIDAADVLAMAADPDIRRWNPLGSVTDEETARAWCVKWADWAAAGSAQLNVYDATWGRVLGMVAVHQIDHVAGNAELGYRVAPWARGQGVASMAVRCVSEWAFGALELTRLQVLHAVDNAASCRVAEKAGYLLEGTTRSSYRYGDGLLHDEHIHGRLVTDPVPGADGA